MSTNVAELASLDAAIAAGAAPPDAASPPTSPSGNEASINEHKALPSRGGIGGLSPTPAAPLVADASPPPGDGGGQASGRVWAAESDDLESITVEVYKINGQVKTGKAH